MSSSSRSRPAMRDRTLPLGRGLLLAAAAALPGLPAAAAEVFYQPIVTLQAETDTNLDLEPGIKQDVQGYIADAATVIGIATKDSDTILKPRVIYRYYPQDSADDRIEAHLDFNTDYRTQRSSANLAGSLQHLDEFNAEETSAIYNDVNPGLPIPTDTGKIVNGATRDSGFLMPKYQYSITPVFGVGASGQYQVVNYSPSDLNHLDFNYYQGRAFVSWTFSQTSDMQLGGFGSKFDSNKLGDRATGTGATFDFNTTWTPLFSTKVSLLYQHTSIDDTTPPLQEGVNAWGGLVAAVYKNQVDQLRLTAGRTISPSGAGALSNVNKVQLQYDRNLTARWSITGALVGLRTTALTSNVEGDDRKYTQALVESRWNMTRYWFIQGGYQYAWQRYQFDVTSAANNRVYIQIGYQGLGQER